ncbi:MAG: hypothetical protein ABI658_17445 [Acidimicrobiales bacterium]
MPTLMVPALIVPALVVAGCSAGTRATLDAASVVDSSATLIVGDITYALDVACFSVGDDLTAVGVGTDAATGKAVKGLIHGPASAYVGLMFGDDEYIYEADAKVPLTIQRDGDRLVGDGITFVRDIDLGSADGASVGVGSVVVECSSTRDEVAPTLGSR